MYRRRCQQCWLCRRLCCSRYRAILLPVLCSPLTILSALTLLLILTDLFRIDRHSLFYSNPNDTHLLDTARNANSHRILMAEEYFSSLKNRGTEERPVEQTSAVAVNVAVTVITVSRNRHQIDNYEPKYLTQNVWRLCSLLEKWRRENNFMQIQLSICNVDDDVTSYQEAITLSKFVRMFSRFKERHISTVHAVVKEKDDYVFCLNKSLELYGEADYVFLVEDDALANDDVFEVLQHMVRRRVERSYSRGEFYSQPSNVAFVKFFHPNWLLNFVSLERERLLELVAYAAILTCFILLAVHIISRRFVWTNSNKVRWKKELFMFSLIVVLACGRTRLSQWRHFGSPHLYSWTPAPSCCTQALLFPHSTALTTLNYLKNATCTKDFGKDSVLEKMLQDLQMTAYLVQPNTFTHIGIYSTLRDHIVEPWLM